MPKVIDILVEMSHLPISIIIIGVGNAKFEKMSILDGDTALVDSKGKK
jgi:copine 5/8/9